QSPPAHADIAMLRFTAHALDASLEDLRTEATPSELIELEPATRVLGDLELQEKYLPRRPSLLPRLMSAINSDSNSMRAMAKIIGEDGALLGGLLRLANSAYYGVRRHKPIESLEKAVALVGTDGLRSLVTTALLHPVMTGTRGPFSSFAEATWEHSQFSAACAELHAVQLEGADAFSARLLVLLRGLASNTVFRIARENCVDVSNIRAAAMAQLLDDWVPPTAQRIAENWQLPADLCNVLSAPAAPGLARSLRFGRLAGALLVLVTHGHMRELSARAVLLADDHRRTQVNRLWSRLAIAHLAIAR
ncbi:MAG TPA: HDOD domain-containing protein, partial [Steroidobacteraceae bacterium]|nr:HDOD domain-containing protein [Steroidobacteraceae bacterium]